VGTGTWSKVSGPGNVTFAPNANTANALVAVTAYGNYTFRWSVVNGTCSNSSTVTVNFMLQPPADAGKGGTECDKDFILNALSSASTGTWARISGPGNAVFSPDNHQPNAKVTIDQFGTYKFSWTTTNVSCTSIDIVEVTFHDLPSINAGTDTVICKGTSIQLDAQGVGSFAWSPANLVSNPAIKNPTVVPESSTTFTVVLTDQYGCKNSDDVIVDVREKPVANAGPDQILEYVFETTMMAELASTFDTGKWSVIAGTGKFTDINLPKTSVGSLSVDVNKFLWTVTNNACPSASDTVVIQVHDFVIPSLITPNMDGNNDYFVLRGSATLGKTELTVFDRRGAQVYKNSNYDNLWNGVDYNENPLPEDTYYYVLKSENGKSLSGYIVIRR
jgi:gliding motility-associated-like protein